MLFGAERNDKFLRAAPSERTLIKRQSNDTRLKTNFRLWPTAEGKFSSKFLYQLSDCCVKLEISVSLHRFEEDMDDYSVIMVKALADRLAEVSSVEIVM